MGSYGFNLTQMPDKIQEVSSLLDQNNQTQAQRHLELLVETFEQRSRPFKNNARYGPSLSMLHDNSEYGRLLPFAQAALFRLKSGDVLGARQALEQLGIEAERKV